MLIREADNQLKNHLKERAFKLIELIKKKFDLKLDFQEESLEILDDLVILFFKEHKSHYYQAIIMIGSFLGEIIIKNIGGKWLRDFSIKKVGKTKSLAHPMSRAKKRLLLGMSESISIYYRNLKLNSCFDSNFALDPNKIRVVRAKLLQDSWDLELLKRMFNEQEHKYVREEAAFLLGKINTSKIKTLIDALGDPKNIYYSAIALQDIAPREALEPLLSVLDKTHSPIVKMQVILALGALKSKKALEPLIKLLNDSNELICHYASISIGKIKGQEALKMLLEILSEKRPGKRLYAISALEQIGDHEAVPALIEAIFSRNEDIREAAVRAFQFIPDERAYKTLILLLKDPSLKIKILAAYALVNIDKFGVLPYLKEMLNDSNEFVRKHIEQLINFINHNQEPKVKCI
ncbi:MAG: HEAT repeat domain-containing protein [Armatimonadetes bacterium]|nr:HEAT repeat domain-containing protein [Armatimonadota bacterium]